MARRRPLEEGLTVRRGKDKGKLTANARPEVRAELEWLGRERALIYKTLVLTRLRRNEMSSLTVGVLHLEVELLCAEPDAADEKNRQGSEIAFRGDLADDLRGWLADRP